MKIVHVVGARPNFMKIAPIRKEMDRFHDEFTQIVVHTGQHYDDQMSHVFFSELGLPKPDVNLEVGSGTHAWQVANVMLNFEPLVKELQPDLVLVVGDVNATVACALVCSKIGVPIAHVEAGLRSRDRTMPEEINRLLTDQISDLLFTTSQDASENLLHEGIDPKKVFFVGNVMIDTLLAHRPMALERAQRLADQYNLGGYGLITLHRPSNVDQPEQLAAVVNELVKLARRTPLVFPAHPRTRQRLENAGLMEKLTENGVLVIGPQGYVDFIALQMRAEFIVTDSGGVQEESTFLGVPCITLRDNTERPVTITHGTNVLAGRRVENLVDVVERSMNEIAGRQIARPPLWDGEASKRIVEIVREKTG